MMAVFAIVTVPGVQDYRKPLSFFTVTSLYLFLTDKSKEIAYLSMHKQVNYIGW